MTTTIIITETFRLNDTLTSISYASRVLIDKEMLTVCYELPEGDCPAYRELEKLEQAYESLDIDFCVLHDCDEIIDYPEDFKF